MRQGHQQNYNKRSRGRGRGGRPGGGGGGGSGGGGGGNPINRVYDSNGPDVKVRGTAQTVADKYMQLARDAHSSGDIVMAESYYQHAEHYLRIVAAAQAYNQHMGAQQYRRPGDGEDGGESRPDAGLGSGVSNADGDSQPAVVAEEFVQQPEAQGYDNDPRQGRRHPEDRQRRHFDRPRPQNDQAPETRPSQNNGGEAGGQWEAPSFLRRPSQGSNEAPRERRPRFERSSRDRQSDSPANDAEPIAAEASEEPISTE